VRQLICLWLTALSLLFILHTSMAVETAAGLPETLAVDKDGQAADSRRSPGEVMLDARLKLVEQGLAKYAPAIGPQEAVLLLAAIKTRIESLHAGTISHQAFDTSTPKTLDDFEQLFWSMHVLDNQLVSASRFFDYAQQLKAIAKQFKPKANDKTDTSVLQTDWNKLKADLADQRAKLKESARDMRHARLMFADKVLTDSKDIADRFLAALALDMDGESLLKDKSLSAEQSAQVKPTLDHARTAAGAGLIEKSRLLFTGLHWWMRGRYGLGTSGGGLMKDAAALTSSDAMFGLLMPINQPVPTAPSANDPMPLVDRRHHYLWQFETRQFTTQEKVKSISKENEFVVGTVTTTSYFY